MTPPAGHAEAEVKRPVQLRMTTEEIALVDAFAAKLSQQSLGANFSRAEVIRLACMAWLRTQAPPPADPLPSSTLEDAPQASLADIGPETPTRRAPKAKRTAKAPRRVVATGERKAALGARVRQMRQSMSHKEIADALNQDGTPTLSGTGRWSNGSVQRVEQVGLQDA